MSWNKLSHTGLIAADSLKMKYLAGLAVVMVVSIMLVFGDDDIHHMTEEELCMLPKDMKTKLWTCMESKLPKSIVEKWDKCAKDIYDASSALEAMDKMCSDKDKQKHESMEKCCEDSKKELSEKEVEKYVKECMPKVG